MDLFTKQSQPKGQPCRMINSKMSPDTQLKDKGYPCYGYDTIKQAGSLHKTEARIVNEFIHKAKPAHRSVL